MSRQQDPPQELVIAQENEASTPDVQEGVPSQNAELTGTLEHEMPAVPNPPECVLVQNLEVVSALKHDSYLSDVQEGVLILKLKPVFSTLEHVHSTSVVQQAVLVQQEPLQVLQSEPTFPIPITKARPNVNHARHCTGCLFITGLSSPLWASPCMNNCCAEPYYDNNDADSNRELDDIYSACLLSLGCCCADPSGLGEVLDAEFFMLCCTILLECV